jgi:hypothetical protein
MTVVLAALALALPSWDGHCQTDNCERHMRARVHAKTVERWRTRVAPVDGYLTRIARCESGLRWHIATGNGYFGGLQFSLRSWAAVGGRGYPHHATPLEQKYRATRLARLQGWSAWPVCSRR